MIVSKAKTALLILFILLSALLWAARPAQAMKRESARPAEMEILEGRSVIVNIPGRNSHTFILEV